MSEAAILLAQYERKIAKVGQWIAIRRYAAGTPRTYTDTPTRAYVQQKESKEFVGAATQSETVAIALVGTLNGMDVNTNDRLITGFFGSDDAGTTPPLNEEGHLVAVGKERAITSVMKRTPGGTVIALEIHAVG